MKNSILIFAFALAAVIMLAGCKKEAPAATGPDYTTNWVGTYNIPNPANVNGVVQVQINKVNNTTLSVILKQEQFSYIYTATTLKNVTVSANTTLATINETENIIEATDLGPYAFTGNIAINNGNLALTTNAVSVRVPVNVEYSPMNFSFTGPRV